MASRKTAAKRRSDSPASECDVERKKYRTRASNRNQQVSYKEEHVDSESCERQDKDFEEEFHTNETIDEASTRSSKQKPRTKRSLKKSPTNSGSGANSVTANLIIPAFKPVNVDNLKVKSELDLSDSDSDDSDNAVANTSKTSKQPSTNPLSSHSNVKHEKGDDCVSEKAENSQSGSVGLAISDIWMKNLEALNHGKSSDTSNDLVIEKENCSVVKTEISDSKPEKPEKLVRNRQRKQKKTPTKEKRKGKKDMDVLDELLECENLQFDSAISEDDENWEKVKEEKVIEEERELPDKVEVMVDVGDVKKKRKGVDIQNIIRLKLNRIRREIQQVIFNVI